jgi:hypothetical protein
MCWLSHIAIPCLHWIVQQSFGCRLPISLLCHIKDDSFMTSQLGCCVLFPHQHRQFCWANFYGWEESGCSSGSTTWLLDRAIINSFPRIIALESSLYTSLFSDSNHKARLVLAVKHYRINHKLDLHLACWESLVLSCFEPERYILPCCRPVP